MSQDKEPTGKSRTKKSTAKTDPKDSIKDASKKEVSVEPATVDPKQQSKTEDNKPIIEEPTLKIEVSKYASLVKVLSGDNWWKVLISVFFIGCVLFSGISLVALAIKKMYPYSDITTNGLGTTTIKSENGEVSYWLFNSASLWANSGITVEKGDIITIRSSGKYHTAIHHLYDATKNNTDLKDKWIGSEGMPDNDYNDNEDFYRSKYRIFPGQPNGALVMQVATNIPFDTPKDISDNDKRAKPDNFYFIGKERQNIYINNSGTLYFAINDIVLNDSTIIDMLLDCLSDVKDRNYLYSIMKNKTQIKRVDTLMGEFDKAFSTDLKYLRLDLDKLKQINKDSIRKSNSTEIKKSINKALGRCELELLPDRINNKIDKLAYDCYIAEKDNTNNNTNNEIIDIDINDLFNELKGNRAIGKLKLGVSKDDKGETVCELKYYHEKGYKTAWFDDNEGSLLIVVEKSK